MNSTLTSIRVLIADDQLLFADNLKLMLETLTQEIHVVGIAINGSQAIEMSKTLSPNMILMDVSMPNIDGVEATRVIKELYPEMKIIMLTSFLDDYYVESALQYGAEGYLLKNINPSQLMSAIWAVHSGSVLLSPLLVASILKKEENMSPEIRELQTRFSKMSNREKEILNLIAKGYNNKRIAEELYISDATVRNYVSMIYAKLGSNDRLEVMSIARSNFDLSKKERKKQI